jgi:tRNA-uridine 2-sulfurtransferase
MSEIPRALIAMSGGVDSAVAAALLRDAGHEAVGLHMRVWHHPMGESFAKSCCSPADIRDAQAVARRLGIPFYVLDLEEAFEREVIAPFVEAYRSGQTPIPCVLCNERLKLGTILDKARIYGASAVATGHYARVERDGDGRWRLHRPRHRAKDQTYYLFSLTQEQLSLFLTPLGDLTKDEVREHARALGLPVADKPDSAEICFIPSGDYRDFLRSRVAEDDAALQPGPFMTPDGQRIGTHRGIAHYTVGQRRGLGISAPRPLYVLEIRPETNTVILGEGDETLGDRLGAGGVTWHEPPEALEGRRLHAQIRARHDAAPCRLRPTGATSFEILFEEPQRSIAPGQAAVIYDEADRAVVAGGWIEAFQG